MLPVATYVSALIGSPWSVRWNCLARTADIELRFFDRQLPLVRYPKDRGPRHELIHGHPVRQQWKQVVGPAHGAIVLMSQSEERRIDEHMGVCLLLPQPLIIHVDRPHGLVADDLFTLRRARGWHPAFYEPT